MGYSRILLYQGFKEIPVLDRTLETSFASGPPRGNNSYWVQGPSRDDDNIQTRHTLPVPSLDKYVFEIETSEQEGAGADVPPQVVISYGSYRSLYLHPCVVGCGCNNEEYCGVRLGSIIRTPGIYLPYRPHQVHIIAAAGSYGYRRISMIHGNEVTAVLSSAYGEPRGPNQYWVGACCDRPYHTLHHSNAFNISAVGVVRPNQATTTTSTTTQSWAALNVEILLSHQGSLDLAESGLNGKQNVEIQVFLYVMGPPGEELFLNATIIRAGQYIGPLGCISTGWVLPPASLNYSFARPRVALAMKNVFGEFEVLGMRAVYLTRGRYTNRPVPYIFSLNGEALDQNAPEPSRYWIGYNAGVNVSSQLSLSYPWRF